jgi:hypothetical protein
MSNIKKRSKKIDLTIKSYILRRKKQQPDIACRTLSIEASAKFNIKISKSSVNSLLKAELLSSPKGRRVQLIFQPCGVSSNVGFSFLYGASLLLGLPKILSEIIVENHPAIKLKRASLEAICEAWILAKAMYNVPLERIENYSKNEIWFILGRKSNKAHLKYFIDTLKLLQVINNQLVTRLLEGFQDVHFLKFTLADGSQFFLDGQLKSVWKDKNIPLNFCVTIDKIEGYVKFSFSGSDPLLIFSARPETMLSEETNNFIFGLDGSSPSKRIRKIEVFSPNGEVVNEASFVMPQRRRFIIGVWPWQYKAIAELEKIPAQGSVTCEVRNSNIHYLEDVALYLQHAENNEVVLRVIVLKATKNGPARIALLTNLEAREWDTEKVVREYLKNHFDFETEHKLFLETVKTPLYFEDFLSCEKISKVVKRLGEAKETDDFFSTLVDILNIYAQRLFFPPECCRWSLLKMKELFYKKKGHVKRDMAEDVLYKLFIDNVLDEKKVMEYATEKFNELNIQDPFSKKLWLVTQ